jgi:hypothetical protein
MKLEDLNFTAKDVAQALGLIVFLSSMWYDLKTEQLNQKKDIEFLQYQINEYKTNKSFKQIAVLPRQIEIKRKEY